MDEQLLINQPYFCSEQILIEKASICECVNITEIDGDSCISPYQTNSKEVSLEYVLRGERSYISLIVYEDMANYLFDLPDFISYSEEERASRLDFKLRNIDEENQRILLMPLIIKIQNLADNKIDQARMAISLVQHIPFEGSNELITLGNNSVNYSRYPYEVLYDDNGNCEEKSQLLAFLLRELNTVRSRPASIFKVSPTAGNESMRFWRFSLPQAPQEETIIRLRPASSIRGTLPVSLTRIVLGSSSQAPRVFISVMLSRTPSLRRKPTARASRSAGVHRRV